MFFYTHWGPLPSLLFPPLFPNQWTTLTSLSIFFQTNSAITIHHQKNLKISHFLQASTLYSSSQIQFISLFSFIILRISISPQSYTKYLDLNQKYTCSFESNYIVLVIFLFWEMPWKSYELALRKRNKINLKVS